MQTFGALCLYRASFQDSAPHILATSASFNSNTCLNSTKPLCYVLVPHSCTVMRKFLWAERLGDHMFHLLCFPSLSYHCHDLHVFQYLKNMFHMFFPFFHLFPVPCKSDFRHFVMTERQCSSISFLKVIQSTMSFPLDLWLFSTT